MTTLEIGNWAWLVANAVLTVYLIYRKRQLDQQYERDTAARLADLERIEKSLQADNANERAEYLAVKKQYEEVLAAMTSEELPKAN